MRTLSLAPLTLLLTAQASLADVSLVSDTRSVSASAGAANTTTSSTNGPFNASPPGTGLRWDANNSALASVAITGATSGASAIQVSGWTLNGNLNLDAQGSVSTSSSVNTAAGGISAMSTASSIFDVVFDVTAGTTVHLQCSVSGVGLIRLDNLTTAQTLFTGFGFYDNTLGPARLRLYADATAINTAPPGTGLGGGYSLLFTATPSPGAAALLLIGGLGTARRRR